MNNHISSAKVKHTYELIVNQMDVDKKSYVFNSKTSFTRNRKLNFAETLKFIVQCGTSSIQNELGKYFDYGLHMPTAAAFVKQRAKIPSTTFKYLFNKFTESFSYKMKTFNKRRVIAVDGSDVIILPNHDEPEMCIKIKEKKAYGKMHLNALFDVLNGIYTDCHIDNNSKSYESRAFVSLLGNCSYAGQCIFLADRGYEGFNTFAHMIEKGAQFVFRVKDIDSNRILSGLDLPDSEFDMTVTKVLVPNAKAFRLADVPQGASVSYIRSDARHHFDFFTEAKPYYFMELRILRFKLPNGEYEALITNIPKQEACKKKIIGLYNMRWSIETSFRALKHNIGMIYFHSKKKEFIKQEIYAKLLVYNFCAFIAAFSKPRDKKHKKHAYKINLAAAIGVCTTFLRKNDSQIQVDELIQKLLIPVRHNRSAPRKIKNQSARYFQYRA